jgi:hypothetical protein
VADHDPRTHTGRQRDASLKRAVESGYERAKRAGYEPDRARKIASESVEKADAQKKKLGHW